LTEDDEKFFISALTRSVRRVEIEKVMPGMRRFVLTGAPGAGKTAIIRQLEVEGFSVVEEAATDIIALRQAQGIAEPWTDPLFIDAETGLQRERQIRASSEPDEVQFHDRSVICTAALAAYLGHPIPETLTDELGRIERESVYQRRVFFIRNLGFVAPTQARRISFEEALRFERIHEETYRSFGYEMVFVEPGTVEDRVAGIKTVALAGGL
jgi:predicted ATPase